MTRQKKVAIAGGGISGLSAAFRLLKLANESGEKYAVTIFEPNRLGGVFETMQKDNCLLEGGPDSFFTKTPEVLDLCHELKIDSEIIPTNSSKRKSMVAKGDELIPLPDGFVMIAPSRMLPFLTSPLLSLPGKIRAIEELQMAAKLNNGEETVATFVERRFGQEMLEKIVQPMVGGIYVGDVHKLSAQSCLPEFVEMERTKGSIIASLAEKQTNNKEIKGARYAQFFSFKKGMAYLIESLANEIKNLNNGDFHARLAMRSLKQAHDKTWQISLSDGSVENFDAVIMALPASALAQVLDSSHHKLANLYSQIQCASSIVVNLVFNKEDVNPDKLDGFGFVVPEAAGRKLLACSFLSVKFKGRASESQVVLRAFVGGVLNAEIMDLSDEKITCLVLSELDYFLGIKKKPEYTTICRWQEAMPQYTIGHQMRINASNEHLEDLPGVFVTGNFISGVGIPKCVELAFNAAGSVRNYLFDRP